MTEATRDLLDHHFDTAFAAPDGIKILRELILTLAMQGKLVAQDPNDPPASELLKQIEVEKRRLLKEGKIKAPKPLPEIKAEEVPYELPEGWKWARVWDVAQIITSGSRDWAKYYSDNGAIFVTMGNLSRGSYDLRMDSIRYVDPPANGEGSRTKLEEDDLLISITGDVGNLGLIPSNFGDAYINQHTCLLRFMPSCRSRYFPELMRSPVAKLQFDAPQRGIKNSFRLGDVGEMVIPLPPLPEQHRIVAKIDQLMARCDELERLRAEREQKRFAIHTAALRQLLAAQEQDSSAKAWQFLTRHFSELYSVKENVDELRKAILQLAVMGKLVPQDLSDLPARKLLQEIEAEKRRLVKAGKIKQAKPLAEIKPEEVPYAVPEGWAWSKLERIVEISSGITKGRKLSGKTVVSVPYLRVANVQRGYLNLNEVKEIEIPNNEIQKFKLMDGDLLITEGGDWDKVGRTCIWRSEISFCAHQNHVFKARKLLTKQSEVWLEKYLNSSIARLYFEGASKQTTNLASINKTQLRGCPVPLPPIPEQHRIVAKIDQLMALCDTLEQQIDAATGKQTELLNSIMAAT